MRQAILKRTYQKRTKLSNIEIILGSRALDQYMFILIMYIIMYIVFLHWLQKEATDRQLEPAQPFQKQKHHTVTSTKGLIG